MESGLIRPTFVALDTNQLGNWCRERNSPDADTRRRAAHFEAGLASAGVIPLLTWHHLEELLAIENPNIAAQAAGLKEADARRVRMDVIPSWRIDQALTTHKQDQAERKGSDLTDRHLAAVAPYADITFVDKRTMETFRRMFAKSKELEGLVRDVRRATNYFDALADGRGST